MGKNSQAHNVVSGPGTPVPMDPVADLCKAYMPAVEHWCADKAKGENLAPFNDYLFSKSSYGQVFRNLAERPIGILDAADRVRSFANMAGYASPVLAAAGATILAAVGSAVPGLRELGPYRFGLCNMVRNMMGGTGMTVNRVLCPDTYHPPGSPNAGRPIEIKRPTEGDSHDGQRNNYAKASPDGKCDSIDCKSCDLPCQNWTDDCQGPFV